MATPGAAGAAVYRAATPADQRRAHGALAAATDQRLNPDRRAWHRAQAVLDTDEGATADLERSAKRARARWRAGRRSRVPATGGRADGRFRCCRMATLARAHLA
ncbi:hypothetical protein GCM10027605_28740 [Micromonospora zhanjiangensis]